LLRKSSVTQDERGKPASIDSLKNVVWALLLGVTVVALVVSTTRARAARSAAEVEAEDRVQLPADKLTAVPMSVELTGAPTKPPVAFAAAFPNTGPRVFLSWTEEGAIVARARLEMDRVTVYDNSWMETSGYPMGDVPTSRGACTDVVVRSLREIGIDLQELVHDDLLRDMQAYGVSSVDPHIDHRRVSTMFTYLQRNAMSVTADLHDKKAWRAGDIVFVAWQFKRGALPEHVGIISDKIGPRGLPLVIENGGPRAIEADSLGRGKVVGHFRALKKRD
jgi:uncharacterized protein YijF (DUF1287 family)